MDGLRVQRDDLTVYYRLVGLQPRAATAIPWVHPGEVLVLPGPKLDSLLVLDDQRPVAVELQLVGPVWALRQPLHDLRAMGVTNAGDFCVGRERRARTGRFLFFFAGMGWIGARCYVVPSGWTCHS